MAVITREEEKKEYIEMLEEDFKSFCTLLNGRFRKGKIGPRITLTCVLPEEADVVFRAHTIRGRVHVGVEGLTRGGYLGTFTEEADYIAYFYEDGLGLKRGEGSINGVAGEASNETELKRVRMVSVEFFEDRPTEIYMHFRGRK